MFKDSNGLIEEFEFGSFVIQGKRHASNEGVGKDIRIIGTEVSEWVERKGHLLRADMITGVLDREDVEELIIGKGADGLVQCPDDVEAFIIDHGVRELHVVPTEEACRLYNRLFHEKRKVAMLAHGTC